ncbi:MAG TPA: hypothetical protein PKW07_06805 [Syntrophorhabdaceae bacterium]|nr:hypothetical protein [Syntrophorhabdaceae bacterium]
MDIHIKRIKMEKDILDSALKGATNLYIVKESGRDFKILCRFNDFSSTISLEDKKGTLHISEETNQVVRQVVELSGACGLNVYDEPVDGLSPVALKGVVLAEKEKNISEIIIKTDDPNLL